MPTVHGLLRLTRRLHRVYERRLQYRGRIYDAENQRLDDLVEQMHRQQRNIEKANRRGWHLAAQMLQGQLSGIIRAMCDAATTLRVHWLDRPAQLPPLHELFAELRHLQTEFDELIIKSSPPTVAVKTDAIVLEGIELGRFLIQLDWPRLENLANSDCFDLIALDPNPPASDSTVTHPHVKDERLCAGDATVPIQSALEQGRIADAFCLVRSVLETYGKKSPYVALENWNGVRCWNCDYVTEGDETYFCERCEHDVCSECSYSCESCGKSLCTSCQTRCAECDAICCPGCLTTSACSDTACCKSCLKVCAVCEEKVASSDFDEATQRCSACNEEDKSQESEELETTVPPPRNGES